MTFNSNGVKLKWYHILFAALMASLTVITGFLVQSIIAVRSVRDYRASLWSPVRAREYFICAPIILLTFFIFLLVLRFKWLRWVIFLGFCALWTYLAGRYDFANG
jgi:hypothetical protein